MLIDKSLVYKDNMYAFWAPAQYLLTFISINISIYIHFTKNHTSLTVTSHLQAILCSFTCPLHTLHHM